MGGKNKAITLLTHKGTGGSIIGVLPIKLEGVLLYRGFHEKGTDSYLGAQG